MKTTLSRLVWSTFCFALALSAVCATEDGAKSDSRPKFVKLVNGGFEFVDDKTSLPLAWYPARTPNSESRCTMTRTAEVAKDGQSSVLISIAKDHSDESVSYNWMCEVRGWTPGEEYALDGWIKTANVAKSPVIVVQCWDKQKKMIGFETTEKEFPFKGDTDWKRVGTKVTIPSGTHRVFIRAALGSSGNQGAKAWFDAIDFRKAK